MSSAILAAANRKQKVKKRASSKPAPVARPEPKQETDRQPGQKRTFFDDPDYQTALLALLCRDEEVLRRTDHLIVAKDFRPVGVRDPTSLHRWVVGECALRFWKKHRKPIGKLLRAELLQYGRDSNLEDKKRNELIAFGKELLTLEVPGADDIIKSAVEYKQEHVKAEAIEELIELQAAGTLTDYDWARISNKVTSALLENGNTTPSTATDLLAKEFKDHAYLVNNLVQTHQMILLAGRPKSGKSWLALQLAIAVATDGQFLKRLIKTSGWVLYVALEDGEKRMKERIQMLLGESINDPALMKQLKRLALLYELLPLQVGGLDRLEQILKQAIEDGTPFKLLVIDHFLAAAGDLKGRDIVRGEYREIAALRKLAEKYGLTIVLVHHTRKMPAADAAETVIGTTGITAAVDSHWVITPGNDDKTKKLEIRGRDIKERTIEMKLLFTPSKRGWQVVAEGAVVKAGPTGKSILVHLRKHGPQGPIEIANALDLSYGNVRENLHRLYRRGLVLKKGAKYEYPDK